MGERKEILFRLDGDLKDRWMDQCERQKISQNTAGVELIRWFLEQEEEVQLMILGQLTPRPDLTRMVMERMAKAERPPLKLEAAKSKTQSQGKPKA